MKLSDLGEFGLINRIEKTFQNRSRQAPLGIGDDAAALFVSPGKTLLATTDMLLEGVHFDLATTDMYSLGWKSAAVNLSDIAAMGGVPRFCLTSLGIPQGISVEQINELYRGFKTLIRKYKVDLVGGDTCRSDTDLMISVTMLGEAEKGKVITRAGARPGDRIFVTGALGDSAAGLELLGPGVGRKGSKSALRTPHSALIDCHLRPTPRIEVGRKLALSGCVTSMIDVSDGLSSDLAHICEQSGVGAEVYAEKIPLSNEIKRTKDRLKTLPLHYALSGGEDYELLFTVPQTKMKKYRSLRMPAKEIGVITRGEIVMVNEFEERIQLVPGGYDHFKE